MVRKIQFTCENKSLGCNERMLYDKRKEHKVVCEYNKNSYIYVNGKIVLERKTQKKFKQHWLESKHYANGTKLFVVEHGNYFQSKILDYMDVILIEAYHKLFCQHY